MPPRLRSDMESTRQRAGRPLDPGGRTESPPTASRPRDTSPSHPISSSRVRHRAKAAQNTTEQGNRKAKGQERKKQDNDSTFAQLNLSVRLHDEPTDANTQDDGIFPLRFYFDYSRPLHPAPQHITFPMDGSVVSSERDPRDDGRRIRFIQINTDAIDLRPEAVPDPSESEAYWVITVPVLKLLVLVGMLFFFGLFTWADYLANGQLVVVTMNALGLARYSTTSGWNWEDYVSAEYSSLDSQAQSLFSHGARILDDYGNIARAMLLQPAVSLDDDDDDDGVAIDIRYARLEHEVAEPTFETLQMAAYVLDGLNSRLGSKGDPLSDEIFSTHIMFHRGYQGFKDEYKQTLYEIKVWHERALFDLGTLGHLIDQISEHDDYPAYKVMNAFENSIVYSNREAGMLERNVREAYIRAGKMIKNLNVMEMATNVSIRFAREKLGVDISFDEPGQDLVTGHGEGQGNHDKLLIKFAELRADAWLQLRRHHHEFQALAQQTRSLMDGTRKLAFDVTVRAQKVGNLTDLLQQRHNMDLDWELEVGLAEDDGTCVTSRVCVPSLDSFKPVMEPVKRRLETQRNETLQQLALMAKQRNLYYTKRREADEKERASRPRRAKISSNADPDEVVCHEKHKAWDDDLSPVQYECLSRREWHERIHKNTFGHWDDARRIMDFAKGLFGILTKADGIEGEGEAGEASTTPVLEPPPSP
ncbi:hypothetical protein EDB80DRAFT_839513 [Ilyonectria destructans]|nr:hypothetical protein EDB80DRAFT_839513 [Ilyonectria destructans]